MAPTPKSLWWFRLPPDYDTAPSESAFLTVLVVFSFFGLCFLVVATWIRCVTGVSPPRRSSSRERRQRRRGGGGFQEWYRRRRSAPPPVIPPQKQWDKKRGGDGGRGGGACASLLAAAGPKAVGVGGGGGGGYNTFSPSQQQQRRASTPSLSGSPSAKRDMIRRSWSMPTPSGVGNHKIFKSAGRRKREFRGRKKSDAGGGHAQIRAWSSSGARGWRGYERGLDVVVEEAGSTPER
ncbi:hypothetical protein FN846DRAFT_944457 [Sphaerosporella brunnea]|uniref:Uncharacterized protein n=1 Tax=Sphaerosporella brunnea TaxID=1250544 RepID=A0A5J5F098_9PEZI|nr:hypothetical protein FN846DRAFT_944457 [Sphaerosporella brunnea]